MENLPAANARPPSMSVPIPRTDVEEFVSATEFTGYQRVPLPYQLEIPGVDRGRAVAACLRNGVSGRSVLDVGTCYGLVPLEAHRRGARRVVGLEPDPDRYGVAQRVAAFYGHRWEIVQATPEQYETRERFDLVTCMNVLHHTPDPIALLRRLADLTAGELVVEFCLADDRAYIREVVEGDGLGAHLQTYLRSFLLRVAAGKLPILAVGNREYHRVFYFSRAGFTNLVKTHLKLFDDIVFVPSPTGRRRVIAYCRRTAAP